MLKLPGCLDSGIRVSDKDGYNAVISFRGEAKSLCGHTRFAGPKFL